MILFDICNRSFTGTMSDVVFNKDQDGYEDDFEKDLDWLITEDGRSEDQVYEGRVV